MFLFEISVVGAFETLMVSIPESVGLLVFGLGLVLIAVLIRSMLAKHEAVDSHERPRKAEGR